MLEISYVKNEELAAVWSPNTACLPCEIGLITEEERADLRAECPHAVFFTGHRKIPAEDAVALQENLSKEVESLVYAGFTTFLCGAARGFDLLAAMAVLRVKRNNPSVRLIYLVPCRNQAEKWSPEEQQWYRNMLLHGEIRLLQEQYDSTCMRKRNQMLVENASIGVAYYNPQNKASGTGMTYRFAEERHRSVINLYTMETEVLLPLQM